MGEKTVTGEIPLLEAFRSFGPKLGDPQVDSIHLDPQLALQLDYVLTALEREDPRAARVVELHYFAGLDLRQVAELLGLGRRTVDRDWRYARAFLGSLAEC